MENTKTMNDYGEIIVNNRWMAKSQLTADDLGGNGTTWKQYRQLCDNIVLSAWDMLHKKDNDGVLGASIAGLFTFFGTDAKATNDYQSRIIASVIMRKLKTSDDYKTATKAKNEAKEAWENAIVNNADQAKVDELKADYDAKVARIAELQATPMHYFRELIPMLDKSKIHATAEARKAIEDCIADIINQRALMTSEQLKAEAQRLADERKGREIRKKKEAAAKKDETKSA